MLKRFVLTAFVAAFAMTLAGCGGPGESTMIPDEKRPEGLSAPGSGKGSGKVDEHTGEEMPEGLERIE